MKKISVLLFLIIISSCTKDKPPVGSYIGTFPGTYQNNGQLFHVERGAFFFISESDKDHIILEIGTTQVANLSKDGKNISGIIDITDSEGSDPLYGYDPITINGCWKKSDGKYVISGDFSYIYHIIHVANQTSEDYLISGQFEIKQE